MGSMSGDNNKESVSMKIVLKHLSNFWRTLNVSLTNCEVNPILT